MKIKSRVISLILGLLCFFVFICGTAIAEPTTESNMKAFDEYLKAHPELEGLEGQSSAEQKAVEHGLSDEEWLDHTFNSPTAPEVETLAGKMDVEDHAQFETYLKALETGTEDIPLNSPEEAELGGEVLDTGEAGGIVSVGTATAISLAAIDGYLLYEDITTGSNPIYNSLIGTFSPEPAELHYASAPEYPETFRMHDVGSTFKEYTYLYGKNAEELGLCEGEAKCLEYVYPWEAQPGKASCGDESRYGCMHPGPSFAERKYKFIEGQYEIQEVNYAGNWYVEGELWWAHSFYHCSEIACADIWERLPSPALEITPTKNDECISGKAPDHEDETGIHFSEEEQLYEYPPSAGFNWEKGNSCLPYGERGKEGYEKFVSGVSTIDIREPIKGGEFAGQRFRHKTYIHLPGHTPTYAPAGKPKTDIEEPTPGAQGGYLARPKVIPPGVQKFIHEQTEEPPYETPLLTAPNCAGMIGPECEVAFIDSGYTKIEIDPKTWEEADLELGSQAVISTTPKEGEETSEETKVKIVDNPLEMPEVVPSYPTEPETGKEFQKQLEEEGWTDTSIDILPDTEIDPHVGSEGLVRTDPTPGTRVKPDGKAETKIDIVVNPADAPPPEGKTPIGGPTEPGIKLPHIALLCTTFPFGVPCWLKKQLEAFSSSSSAPIWSIGPIEWDGHKIPKAEIDLAKIESIMEIVRPFMVIFGGIGIVFFFYKVFTGNSIGGGENPSGQVPDPEGNPMKYGEPGGPGAEEEFN